MGELMDMVMREVDCDGPRVQEEVEERVGVLRRRCAWTAGTWPVLGCAWNEFQNTGKDKRLLAEYILDQYDSAMGEE